MYFWNFDRARLGALHKSSVQKPKPGEQFYSECLTSGPEKVCPCNLDVPKRAACAMQSEIFDPSGRRWEILSQKEDFWFRVRLYNHQAIEVFCSGCSCSDGPSTVTRLDSWTSGLSTSRFSFRRSPSEQTGDSILPSPNQAA